MTGIPAADGFLPSLLSEGRDFVAAVRFARPGWFALLAVPLLLGLLDRFRRRGDRAAAAAFGTVPTRRPVVARSLAWLATATAAAGPGWGTADTTSVAVGRDVILVLDFSRSMWAADGADGAKPARWQSAVAAARDLVRTLRSGGGDRVAVVVFAARPVRVVPLTTDLDHADAVLALLDARTPPAGINPKEGDVSGTRIGAALAVAAATADDRFPGTHDILLFTDADDPAADDEWQSGVTAARRAGVPVHVFGIGNAGAESFVYSGDEPLEGPTAEGVRSPIRTKLHEPTARAIADAGRGEYVPAGTAPPAVGEWHRTRRAAAVRELESAAGPAVRDRSAGFYLAAFAAWAWAWAGRRRTG